MAAGSILSVLAQVPWGQVIDAAPKVAEGASKLWKSVKRRGQEDEATVEDILERSAAAEDAAGPAGPDALQALQILTPQVQRLQKDLSDLREEMQAATGLIKDLAEQNTALVQRIELNRRKLQRLTVACALLGVVAGVAFLLPRVG